MNIAFEKNQDGSSFVLRTEQWIPRSVSEVFSFFSRAENLEKLTPPFIGFKVLDCSSAEIREGTLIRYRLKLHGIPVGWTTRIEKWEPGVQFVDTQLRGPCALWHHIHTFEARDGGTVMRDIVRFRLPFGMLGRIFGGWFVKRDVRVIFDYRREIIARLFPVKS